MQPVREREVPWTFNFLCKFHNVAIHLVIWYIEAIGRRVFSFKLRLGVRDMGHFGRLILAWSYPSTMITNNIPLHLRPLAGKQYTWRSRQVWLKCARSSSLFWACSRKSWCRTQEWVGSYRIGHTWQQLQCTRNQLNIQLDDSCVLKSNSKLGTSDTLGMMGLLVES